MTNLLLIFPILAILCSPALYFILGRPKWLKRVPKTVTTDQTISVIIPARNEERNIGHLLSSLQKQTTAPLEIIVVNDDSEDATATLSEKLGARVIEAGRLPDGWNGKSWACHQGALHATGDWLLFLDADLTLSEEAVASLLPLTGRKAAAYSLCPFHKVQRPYEELSAFFNVLMLAGSDAFTPFRDREPMLFGQCLFVSNASYQKVGTHESIRNEILENFQLSRQFQHHGIPCVSFLGKGLVSMRMFPEGVSQLISSWLKGGTSGAEQTSSRALLYSSIWLSGLMFTLISLCLLLSPLADPTYQITTSLAYLLGVIQSFYAFRLSGNFSILNALFFPVTLVFYQGLFFNSLIRKKKGIKPKWKGRTLD